MGSMVRLRPLVSTALAALVLTLSVAVPLLDRADGGTDPVLESEHNPSTCPPTHDHTVCTQFGANLPIASEGTRHAAVTSVRAARLPDGYRVRHAPVAIEANRSRAPPSI
jgi:hypothetical protein